MSKQENQRSWQAREGEAPAELDSGSAGASPSQTTPRIAEEILLRHADRLTGEHVLCTSLGRAQFAAEYATRNPTSHILCNFLDHHLADQAKLATQQHPQVEILCESDFPETAVDLAVIPCSLQGNAELTREFLQQAHERLRLGGQLATATDNPQDHWLHEECGKLFDKVTRVEDSQGMMYVGTKTKSLKKQKDFSCEFTFRDRERLLKIVTRPSVFSHRRLDVGARALIEVMQINPGERVFEIGCGSGAVTIAAAARATRVQVAAVDSNPRAVECTLRSAQLNQLTNITTELTATATSPHPGKYDVALANPPYYSQHRLAEIFIHGALRALHARGRLYVVTKHPAWYEQALPLLFQDVIPHPTRGYVVYECRR